jgi:mannose-6-phosphate isomerase-like protein (cupin superfamily)
MFQMRPSLRICYRVTYEKHQHQDHEELYYIINGKGKIKIGEEESQFRDGNIIYIPEITEHTPTNNGEEMIESLTFGGFMDMNSK